MAQWPLVARASIRVQRGRFYDELSSYGGGAKLSAHLEGSGRMAWRRTGHAMVVFWLQVSVAVEA
jgi:hypothetical protein